MNWLVFTVSTLCVLRLALLIAEDDGPANALRKGRNAIPRKSSFWSGVRCVRCTSIWSAALVTASLWWFGEVPGSVTPIYGLALSGGAILLNRL
jgi:hypothetical protein